MRAPVPPAPGRRSAPPQRLRASGPVVAVVVLIVLLGTACGREGASSSASTPTTFIRSLDSVEGRAGTLRLLHVHLATPGERGTTHIAGSGAELFLTLANDGDGPDTLISASSEVSGQVVFRDGDAEPTPELQVEVPPGGVAPLRTDTGPHLELVDLAEPLRSGTSISITFEFQDAGSVTLPVPVAVYDGTPPTPTSEPADPT